MQEQADFLKRIGELLNRGYPIAEAIESISFLLHRDRKKELKNCLNGLKNGLPFHHVLTNLGFNEDLIGYVYFAEQHGSFAEALLEGSRLALKKEQDKHKVLKLIQYPLLLIIITAFLFLFVEKTLLPRFTTLFNSMNLEVNFFTKIVNAFGRFFPAFLFTLCVFLSLAVLYYFIFFRKISILQQKTQLVRIPLIGHILKLVYTHYFSIQLSFLLSAGISITEALLIFEANHRQSFYSQLASDIKLKLITGEKLVSILNTYSFFEDEFALIVRHGQDNGKLEQELFFFSQHCSTIMEEIIDKGVKTIQPALYTIIGFLVVSMYLAILLPMFHLMDGI